jgi:hypothetical protein
MIKKLSFLHELCWLRGFEVSGKISQDSQPGLNVLVFVWNFKEPLRTAARTLRPTKDRAGGNHAIARRIIGLVSLIQRIIEPCTTSSQELAAFHFA